MTRIPIRCVTMITTRIDPDELKESKKLGEGSFGIVYLGEFRGEKVAIKKMKQVAVDQKAIEEFEKEVAMLDKFRNDYMIHFYGAVFIQGKICMVTEFAQYGSLQDLMNKRAKEPIYDRMKMKILIDGAKGIQYLHNNAILHRDIKPDNFLVVSLVEDVPINAKLTDFGSARNVNALMCNMTFTKGVGTPIYMSPEVLCKKRYERAADVFAFAITMYQTYVWRDVYPKSQFKFPWKIAEFITNGKRLEKTDEMTDKQYEIIQKSWAQEPIDRITISQIIELLTAEYEGREIGEINNLEELDNGDKDEGNENEQEEQQQEQEIVKPSLKQRFKRRFTRDDVRERSASSRNGIEQQPQRHRRTMEDVRVGTDLEISPRVNIKEEQLKECRRKYWKTEEDIRKLVEIDFLVGRTPNIEKKEEKEIKEEKKENEIKEMKEEKKEKSVTTSSSTTSSSSEEKEQKEETIENNNNENIVVENKEEEKKEKSISTTSSSSEEKEEKKEKQLTSSSSSSSEEKEEIKEEEKIEEEQPKEIIEEKEEKQSTSSSSSSSTSSDDN